MSTAVAEQLLTQLRSLVPLGTQTPSDADIKSAHDVLRKLKLELVKFQSVPPFSAEEMAGIRKVLLLQRETLELACFLSLYARDVKAFERYIVQLKTFYNDYRAVMPPSNSQGALLGLYLLGLLSQNQIADFHTEYELMAHTATSEPGVGSGAAASGPGLPPASPTSSRSVSSSALLSSALIAFPVALEQQLMEGCYNQILSARQRQSLPLPIYSIFLDSLADTVRNKIADCSEQAYDTLTVADLQRMMQLQSADEALKFVQSRAGWAVNGDKIVFLSKQTAANTQVDALKTIKQTLEYATELERIV